MGLNFLSTAHGHVMMKRGFFFGGGGVFFFLRGRVGERERKRQEDKYM